MRRAAHAAGCGFSQYTQCILKGGSDEEGEGNKEGNEADQRPAGRGPAMMAREWHGQSALAVDHAVAALERLDMLRARNGEHHTRKDRHVNERVAVALRAMQEARDLLDEQLHRGMRP